MKTLIKSILPIIAMLFFVACSNDDDSNNNNNNQGTSSVKMKLVDAPGDYEAVYIDVQDVVIKYSGDDNEVSLGDVNAGIYDLLELTGGASVLLVDEDIPAGTISQIRLVLGSENTIVVDGQTYDLATPSAQQSGLKLQVNETLEDGILYEFILDFDVEESIVTQGNGGYSLKPVIRTTLEAETGIIIGQVLPLGIQTLVTASDGVVEVSSYTDANGEYALYGLPNGTYDVTLEADITLGFPPITIPDVEVVAGAITELEVVTFD